jgi:hypothetical protein
VQRLPVGKRLAAHLARRCAGSNFPVVHEHGNLTTNDTNEHEEISQHPQIAQVLADKKCSNEICGIGVICDSFTGYLAKSKSRQLTK